VRITTRPPEAPESEIVVRDVPSDRVKIKPQQEVADAPSRDTLQGPKPKPQTRPIDPGYYIAIIKVSAFREIRIRRKCIEPFEFPEVCKLPHRQRESRPVYFNSVPFPDQQTVDQQLPLQ
jgi:hypothetical protein